MHCRQSHHFSQRHGQIVARVGIRNAPVNIAFDIGICRSSSRFDEDKEGELFDDKQRFGHAAGPEGTPDLVDLRADGTSKHMNPLVFDHLREWPLELLRQRL